MAALPPERRKRIEADTAKEIRKIEAANERR